MRVSLLAFALGEHTSMLAAALAEHADVTLAIPPDGAPVAIPGVRMRYFDRPRLRDPLGQVRVCAALRRDIHRDAPDVLHLQQGHLWFNALLPTLRVPLALTVHDPRNHPGDAPSRKTPQWVMDFGFRRAGRLMVHGAHVKRELVEKCAIAEDIVDILPPPLTEPLPQEFGAPPCDPPTVLFFGRIWPYKGLDVLLRAQPLVSREVPDATFVIAGGGEEVARYGVRDCGRFHVINRWISNAERAELFRAATVVALPYVEASQSAVIPTAYGHARPVVATRVGGLPEVVHEGETGLLVAPRDERALADALIRVLRDPVLRRTLSAGARRYAERELSPARVARETIASYERLLASSR